jgi:hypothetical protein
MTEPLEIKALEINLVKRLAVSPIQKVEKASIAKTYREMHAVASMIAIQETAKHLHERHTVGVLADVGAAEEGKTPPSRPLLESDALVYFSERVQHHMDQMLRIIEAMALAKRQ